MFEDLLQTITKPAGPIHWGELFARLIAALIMGFGVMFIYRVARRGQPANRSFEVTLVLLAILISIVTRVIGDSVARAFSLVGALSIVRFRTVVRDTQDTAYVIFAVVVGMAVGANLAPVGLAGMAVVLAAILLLGLRRTTALPPMQDDCVLHVRVSMGTLPEELSRSIFPKFLSKHELISIETAKQGTMLDASYTIRFRRESSPAEFLREVNKVEGVQGIEIKSGDALEEK